MIKVIDNINAKLSWFVAYMMIPLIAIMMYEILMRYFFNKPSLWAYETSLFIYGGYIALAGAYTLLAGGHVNVDIVWGRLSVRNRAIADIVTSVFTFIYIGVIFWTSLHFTIESWQIGERTMTHWGPPYYPLRTTLPVATFLMLLQALAKLVRDIFTAIYGKEMFPTEVKGLSIHAE